MLTSRQSTMENTRSFDYQKSEDNLLFQPTSRSCYNFESNNELPHHYTQYKRKSVDWTADFENEQTSQSARNKSVKHLLKTMRSKMNKHGQSKLKMSSPSTSKLCGHSYSTVQNFDGGKHRDNIFLPKCDVNSSNTPSEKDEPIQWKKFENFAKIFGNKRKGKKRLDSHVEFGKHNNSTSEFGTEVLPYFQRTSEKHDTTEETGASSVDHRITNNYINVDCLHNVENAQCSPEHNSEFLNNFQFNDVPSGRIPVSKHDNSHSTPLMSNRMTENASDTGKKPGSRRNDREKLCWWLGKSPKQIRKRLKASLGKKSTRTSTVASSVPTQFNPGYLSAYDFAEIIGKKDFFSENLLFDCRWESSSNSLLYIHSILNAIRVNHLYNVHVPTTYWESMLKSRINFSQPQPSSEQIFIILIVDKTNSPWKTRIQQTLQHLVHKLTEENTSESPNESSSKPGTVNYFKYFEILISEITNDLPWLLNPKIYSNGQNILELRPPLSTLNNHLWYLEPHSWKHLSEFSPSYITSLINNKKVDCILVITYNAQKDLRRVASLKLRIPYLLVDTASILNECKVLSKFEQILNFLNNPIEYIRQGPNFKTFPAFSQAFCSTDNQTCVNNILITGSNAPACLTILVGLIMITCPCQLNAAIEQFFAYHDYSNQLTEEYLKILTLLNNYLLNLTQKSNKKDLRKLKHCSLSSRIHDEGRISSNRLLLNLEENKTNDHQLRCHRCDSEEGKELEEEEEKIDNQQQDDVIPFRLPTPDVISEEMMHQLEQFKIRA